MPLYLCVSQFSFKQSPHFKMWANIHAYWNINLKRGEPIRTYWFQIKHKLRNPGGIPDKIVHHVWKWAVHIPLSTFILPLWEQDYHNRAGQMLVSVPKNDLFCLSQTLLMPVQTKRRWQKHAHGFECTLTVSTVCKPH